MGKQLSEMRKQYFLLNTNYPRLFSDNFLHVEMSSEETQGHSVKNKNTEKKKKERTLKVISKGIIKLKISF